VGLGGVVLDRRERALSPEEHAPPDVLRPMLRMIRSALAAAPATARCVGIGVGVCGVVAQADGRVRFAPNLGWVDVPLGTLLRKRLATDLPIALGNDANLGVLAEQVRGAAQGAGCVVYLSSGVGVGAGIVMDGRPLLGTGGFAGEIGHMVVNPDGRACRCGSRGCWETEIGEPAIRLATGATEATSIAEIVGRAASGDREAMKGLRRVGDWLGVGVANLVNVFNPDVVVFGGTLREVFPFTRDRVESVLHGSLAAPGEHVILSLPALGDDSTLLGAAETAFEPLLDDPVGVIAEARRNARLSTSRA
jgi:predicted NBD/HSP70 family sugar kinase